MPLRDWKISNEDHTTSSDTASPTNFTQRWSQATYLEASGDGRVAVLYDQQYRTGGVQKLLIDGIGRAVPREDRFVKKVFLSRPPLEKRLAWLTQYESDFLSESDVDVIAEIYAQIDRMVNPKTVAEIDELIEALPKLKLSYEIKASIIRYTWSLRGRLPSWKKTFAEITDDLLASNLDAEGIFIGLK